MTSVNELVHKLDLDDVAGLYTNDLISHDAATFLMGRVLTSMRKRKRTADQIDLTAMRGPIKRARRNNYVTPVCSNDDDTDDDTDDDSKAEVLSKYFVYPPTAVQTDDEDADQSVVPDDVQTVTSSGTVLRTVINDADEGKHLTEAEEETRDRNLRTITNEQLDTVSDKHWRFFKYVMQRCTDSGVYTGELLYVPENMEAPRPRLIEYAMRARGDPWLAKFSFALVVQWLTARTCSIQLPPHTFGNEQIHVPSRKLSQPTHAVIGASTIMAILHNKDKWYWYMVQHRDKSPENIAQKWHEYHKKVVALLEKMYGTTKTSDGAVVIKLDPKADGFFDPCPLGTTTTVTTTAAAGANKKKRKKKAKQ